MKEITISLKNNDKAYFLGDFHFGSPNHIESKKRELKILCFLNSIESNLKELFLLGDIFDFWFEYKEVVPKGFTRFLGKITELSDKGVNIHLILGNHDMWVLDYFQKELGINVYPDKIKVLRNYFGTPGRVITRGQKNLIIICKSNAILIEDLYLNKKKIFDINKYFKLSDDLS